jgi:hypothetical protein
MANQAGKRERCHTCNSEVIITKGGVGELSCTDIVAEVPMLVGKRYRCDTCASEALVIRAGTGEPTCCDTPMILSKPKETKSAD